MLSFALAETNRGRTAGFELAEQIGDMLRTLNEHEFQSLAVDRRDDPASVYHHVNKAMHAVLLQLGILPDEVWECTSLIFNGEGAQWSVNRIIELRVCHFEDNHTAEPLDPRATATIVVDGKRVPVCFPCANAYAGLTDPTPKES